MAEKYSGLIIKCLGGLYTVESPDGICECKARGVFRNRGISPCVGDNVTLEDGVITEIAPRRNCIIRPPLANLDQLIFIVSTCEPAPNYLILDKFIAIAEYKDITKRMQDIKFDCTEMGASTENYSQFFDNDGKYRWVIRHATGTDLNGGSQPAPTAPLQGKGVKTVYRYYDEYEAEWSKKGPDGENTEVTAPDVEEVNNPTIGSIIGSNGKFYKNVTDAKNATGKDAVAIVVCFNGKKRVEKDAYWNGLAILLKPTERLAFGLHLDDCGDGAILYTSVGENMGYVKKKVGGRDTTYFVADELNGIYYTQYYSNGCGGRGHDHPAVKACNYVVFPNIPAFSQAFMPSAGQFILAMKGLGIEWNREHGFNNEYWSGRDAAKETEQLNHARAILEESDCDINVNTIFMTTSKSSGTLTFRFNYQPNTLDGGLDFVNDNVAFATRPFIAFAYDGGATED